MSLANADARRALRAVVQAIVELVLLALLWILTGHLAGHADALLSIARLAFVILAIGEVGYVMENGIRAVRLKTPDGSEATFEGDTPAGGNGEQMK